MKSPSLKLLEKVLDIRIGKVNLCASLIPNELRYIVTLPISNADDHSNMYAINIYEFADKCKMWALDRGFVISSCSENAIIHKRGFELTFDNIQYSCVENTEQEAIFNACQYILDTFLLNTKKD